MTMQNSKLEEPITQEIFPVREMNRTFVQNQKASIKHILAYQKQHLSLFKPSRSARF